MALKIKWNSVLKLCCHLWNATENFTHSVGQPQIFKGLLCVRYCKYNHEQNKYSFSPPDAELWLLVWMMIISDFRLIGALFKQKSVIK